MSKTLQLILWALLAIFLVVLIINFAEGLRSLAASISSAESLGFLFIVIALAAFIVEMLTPGFGLFAALGVVTLTIGSILLFQINPWLIILIDFAAIVTITAMVNSTLQAQRRKITTGKEEIVGSTAEVRQILNPAGMVLFEGELWKAISDEGIMNPGEIVIVSCVDGLTLHVVKNKDGGKC